MFCVAASESDLPTSGLLVTEPMVERNLWLCAAHTRRDGLIMELFHRYGLSQGILLYLQDSKLRSERKGTVCLQGAGTELGAHLIVEGA